MGSYNKEGEPPVREHLLKYEYRFYEAGENRAVITENKVSDENAWRLTDGEILKRILVCDKKLCYAKKERIGHERKNYR